MKSKLKMCFVAMLLIQVLLLAGCKQSNNELNDNPKVDAATVSQEIVAPKYKISPASYSETLWLKDCVSAQGANVYFIGADSDSEYVCKLDSAGGTRENLFKYQNTALISLAVSDSGEIYVLCSSSDGDTYEIQKLAADGRQSGTFALNTDEFSNQIPKEIAYADSRIFLLTDQKLVAIKYDSAKVEYEIPIGQSAHMTVLKDGTVVIGHERDGVYRLQYLDEKKRELVTKAEFNYSFTGVYCGITHDLYLNSAGALFSYDFEESSLQKLFSWSALGIISGAVAELDNSVLICSGRISADSPEPLITLVPAGTSYSETSVIRFATTGDYIDYRIQEAIRRWNVENPQCQIEIVDYYAYVDGTDNRAAQMKLAADIASGEIPDIYDFSLNSIDTAPSIGQYARRGMLENIYSYLDNDAQLSRSDFFEGYLKSLELNGGLYEVVPEYSLETTFANSRVVGTQDKWTYEHFNSIVNSEDYYQQLFDEYYERTYWLGNVIAASGDRLVDWAHGKCYFDSDYFRNVLEAAKDMPEHGIERNYSTLNDCVKYNEGLLYYCNINDIWMASIPSDAFGADYCFVGLPEVGNVIYPSLSFGISSYSENKEECWQFLRQFLLPENSKSFFMSPRRDVMKARVEEAWKQVVDGGNGGLYPYGLESMNSLLDAIDNARVSARHDAQIWQIVLSESGAYFSSQKTVDETMQIIQSRAQIYISEQS